MRRILEWSLRSLLLLWTVSTLPGCSQPPAAQDGAAVKQAVPVKTVAVAEQAIRRTTLQPATISAFYEARVEARISGYVIDVQVDIGDVVAQGDILAILNLPAEAKQQGTLQAQVQRLLAEEDRAGSEVQLATAHVQAREAALAQARAESIQVESTLAATEAEFQRTRDLVERRSLESRVLDEVTKRRDAALAGREAAASAIASAAATVEVAKAQVASAQASQRVAQAETLVAQRQLEELQVQIEFGSVRAPFAGVVTERSVEQGDLVNISHQDRPLFVVSQIDKVRVHIPVPEGDAPYIDRDNAITLSLPSFPAEAPLLAKVTRFSSRLDPQTRTMLVEAVIENPERKLLPGMFGQATIQLGSATTVQSLPARAIRHSENGAAYVYRVNDDSTVNIVPVTTGSDDGETLEIVSGLKSGERVVDAHIQRFSDGQSVTVLTN
ncbi:MAG: efflux RND transporter periplasmic adaptor subunit [Planctomycetaceae bacterium]|nr:efflux RND transporter periplasmic adaptor subunit [Planctomycetaceae bacterium]